MKTITANVLKSWIVEEKEYVLIDVREDWEHQAYSIGGTNIPLGEIMLHKNTLDREKPTIIYCEKGIRSAIAIQRLEASGYNNLINLEGGMSKWRQEEAK